MIVLPLGLEAKTRDFPFATFGILLLTVVSSLLSLDRTDKFEKKLLESDVTKARFSAQLDLAVAACEGKFSREQCEHLGRAVRAGQSDEIVAKTYRLYRNLRELEPRAADGLLAWALQESWDRSSDEIRALPQFLTYARAKHDQDELKAELNRRFGFLSRATFSPPSLFLAQVSHAGWMHLISNMIFFLLFAIPLEQRIGAFWLLLLYVLGGSAGVSFQIWTQNEWARPLLGASANVFAVAAGFMLAFWSQTIRIWVNFFFLVHQVVRIRTWMFFPLFILLQEVAGAIEPAGGHVAHVAHLAGFVVGGLVMYVVNRLKPVAPGFAFPFEQSLFEEAEYTAEMKVKLNCLVQILDLHPTCAPALKMTWRVIANWRADWKDLRPTYQKFLSQNFVYLMDYALTDARSDLIWLLQVQEWPFAEWIQSRHVAKLLALVHELQSSEPQVAIKLVDILIEVELRAQGDQNRSSEEARSRNIERLHQLRRELMQPDSETGKEPVRAAN